MALPLHRRGCVEPPWLRWTAVAALDCMQSTPPLPPLHRLCSTTVRMLMHLLMYTINYCPYQGREFDRCNYHRERGRKGGG